MKKIIKQLRGFLDFIENPPKQDKLYILEKYLIELYVLGLNLQENIVPNDYEPIREDYLTLRNTIAQNFKELGLYHTVLNQHDIEQDPEIGVGDAVDDLTDIIKDLKSCLSLADENTFFWQLHFSFHAHIKDHLVALLHYLPHTNKSA